MYGKHVIQIDNSVSILKGVERKENFHEMEACPITVDMMKPVGK